MEKLNTGDLILLKKDYSYIPRIKKETKVSANKNTFIYWTGTSLKEAVEMRNKIVMFMYHNTDKWFPGYVVLYKNRYYLINDSFIEKIIK